MGSPFLDKGSFWKSMASTVVHFLQTWVVFFSLYMVLFIVYCFMVIVACLLFSRKIPSSNFFSFPLTANLFYLPHKNLLLKVFGCLTLWVLLSLFVLVLSVCCFVSAMITGIICLGYIFSFFPSVRNRVLQDPTTG